MNLLANVKQGKKKNYAKNFGNCSRSDNDGMASLRLMCRWVGANSWVWQIVRHQICIFVFSVLISIWNMHLIATVFPTLSLQAARGSISMDPWESSWS